MIKFVKWVCSIEEAISTSIKGCYPRYWNENHITCTWLKAARSKGNFQHPLHPLPKPMAIAWDAFKATGNLEQSHGDVAILVKMTFPNRNELLGVAFLEAKRIYDSGKFEQIGWSQLQRQFVNSHAHHLLLYDHEDISFSSEYFWPLYDYCYRLPYKGTRASVIPTPYALALQDKTRGLHKFSMPLSYQLCCRYLLGHDLDHNPRLVCDVQQSVPKGVKYLIVGHVAIGENAEASVESVEFNQDIYQRIGEGHDTNE